MSGAARVALAADDIARHLDAAPVGLALVRHDGTIAYANRTLARWLDKQSSEVTDGATFKSLLAPPSRIYFETHVVPLLGMNREVTEIAVDLAGADAVRIPVLLNATVAGRDSSQLTQFALQRVEERRRYEAEVLNERRRAEKALDDLQRAQGRIIELTQMSAMGTLSSSLAHELNQPLTVVTNMLGGLKRLLANHQASPLVDEVLGDVEEAVRQAVDIIRKMRAVTEGKHSLATAVHLSETIDTAIETAVSRTGRQDPVFDVQVTPFDLAVRGRREQLTYVISSLFINAIEAAPADATARIVVRVIEVDRDMVELRVTDYGDGIPLQVQSALFKAFTTTKPGRSGISLANARTIIEASGGRITASVGVKQNGTTFAVTLPIHRSHG